MVYNEQLEVMFFVCSSDYWYSMPKGAWAYLNQSYSRSCGWLLLYKRRTLFVRCQETDERTDQAANWTSAQQIGKLAAQHAVTHILAWRHRHLVEAFQKTSVFYYGAAIGQTGVLWEMQTIAPICYISQEVRRLPAWIYRRTTTRSSRLCAVCWITGRKWLQVNLTADEPQIAILLMSYQDQWSFIKRVAAWSDSEFFQRCSLMTASFELINDIGIKISHLVQRKQIEER